MPLFDVEDWGAKCSGRGLDYDSKLAVEHFKLKGTSWEEFKTMWKYEFDQIIKTPGALKMMDGFDDLYKFARSKGMKIAVASSSDRVGLEFKLKNGVVANSKVLKGLEDFDAVLCSERLKQTPVQHDLASPA